MSNSINQLNIYMSARKLEDAVVTLADSLPEDQAFPLADNLRRAATAVSHYIHASHNYYSYNMKMESLHQARTEAEKAQSLLVTCLKRGYITNDDLAKEYTTVIKQSWGLIKYFKAQQTERLQKAEVEAKEQLVKN